MDPLSTLPPTSEVTEHDVGNSCCQIRDGFLSVTLPTIVQRRTSITVYMRNLALSDLLLALCLPFRIAFQDRSEPHVFCNIVGAFFYLNITLASGTVWVVNSAFMMPFFFEKRGKGPCDHKCFHFRSKSTMAASFNMAAVAAFFIVLLLFLYFYSKIFAKLHRVSSMKAQQLNKKTTTRAITKTFVVLIIFIVCFTPYHIVRIPYILAQVGAIGSLPWKQGLHLANEIVLCISALNSCLDPIIFFFLSSSFRRAVLCTIRGRLKGALMSNQGRLTPSRLADAVTPLWRLPYQEQLQVKYKSLREVLQTLTSHLEELEGARNIVCVRADHMKNIPLQHKQVAQCYEQFIRRSPLGSCILFHEGGHWRELVVRTSQHGHTMAIVTFHPQQLGQEDLAAQKALLKEFFTCGPGAMCALTSLYFQESTMTRCSHELSPFQLLHGEPHIFEDVLGLKFRISPDAFFQVVQKAIEDARWNAAFNGISNCEFHSGKAEAVLPALLSSWEDARPLVAVVNPSRAGIHHRVVRAIRSCRAIRRLLYISCKPEGEAMRNFLE
ncbi:hypothetical protein ASZ78_000828 [Callipepla squamata]|uniref:G-protein coupled receptors family 1 profile domain-containing protein n=1 Tax=Callipepla squamata TaxID=9009 RepID=A0A226MF12_CALSU|nr:hypothetical protein ASZ78_000828 [Callipepla squamata]